jgi:hypothetical protein
MQLCKRNSTLFGGQVFIRVFFNGKWSVENVQAFLGWGLQGEGGGRVSQNCVF